jgi:hypothetical protein
LDEVGARYYTGWAEALAVEDEGLGRSRGGLTSTSKVELAVDATHLPMSILITPGQAGDNPQLLAVLDQVSGRRDGPGGPRQRPGRVIADTAYSHLSTRYRRRSPGFLALVIAAPLGVSAGRRRSGIVDRLVSAASVAPSRRFPSQQSFGLQVGRTLGDVLEPGRRLGVDRSERTRSRKVA